MLKRTIIVSAVILNSSAAFAIDAASVAPQQVQAAAAKAQVQGDATSSAQPTQQAATAQKGAGAAQTPSQLFVAGMYLGLSIGPKAIHNGLPAINKSFATIVSGGAAIMLTDKLYLAGEIFADSNLSLKNYKNNNINVKSNWTYGFDFIPGYMITRYILGYMRLGFASANFVATGDSRPGGRIGIGAQSNICKGWDLRTEYIYTNFKYSAKLGRPQMDQFNLGIVYKFI